MSILIAKLVDKKMLIAVCFLTACYPLDVYASGVVAAQKQKQQAQQQQRPDHAGQQQAYQDNIFKQLEAERVRKHSFYSKDKFSLSEPSEPLYDLGGSATLSYVWEELEYSSEIWGRMLDREPKVVTVDRYIKAFNRHGVKIRLAASHYVDMIDAMATQNPGILKQPFRGIMQLVAIIEYDFDNGMNKDLMAKKILGEHVFSVNKRRLGR